MRGPPDRQTKPGAEAQDQGGDQSAKRQPIETNEAPKVTERLIDSLGLFPLRRQEGDRLTWG